MDPKLNACLKMRTAVMLANLTLFAGPVAAQQPATPDRRDYMISALQEQRNVAADRDAICRSDFSAAIQDAARQRTALEQEGADLKRKLAESEKERADLKLKLAEAEKKGAAEPPQANP